MGGTQELNLSAKEINAIISSVLSKQIVNQGTSYSSAVSNRQITVNSTGCTNSMDLTSNKTIIVNTQIFSDQTTYQKSVNDISNQISQAVEEAMEGGVLPSEQKADLQALVASIVVTSLNSSQMNLSQTSTTEITKNTQVCAGSSESSNIIVGDSTVLENAFYKSYTSSSSVQDTSTTIKNILDQKASATKTGMINGIISSIVWGLVAIAAILIIVVVVGIVVYMATLLKL
jgi:hypothetical protein